LGKLPKSAADDQTKCQARTIARLAIRTVECALRWDQYRSFSANWIVRLGAAVEAIWPTFAELMLAPGAEKFA
jgi:hypothetical protein